MTPEEAIELLSNELIVITDMIEYCRDFEKESDLALAYRVKRQEAHEIAISSGGEAETEEATHTILSWRKRWKILRMSEMQRSYGKIHPILQVVWTGYPVG